MEFGEFWTWNDNSKFEEREEVTEDSRMEGRRGVFRRPENHPMRVVEGGRRRRREGRLILPKES